MKRAGCEEFEQFEKLQWQTDVDAQIEKFLSEECAMKVHASFGRTEWQPLWSQQNKIAIIFSMICL
jgi:hypothetical protein